MLALRPSPLEPFQLACAPAGGIHRWLAPVARAALTRALCFKTLNDLYDEVHTDQGADDFIQRLLERIHIRMDFDESQLSRIPKKGPLLVVANHPFGAIDGMMLYLLLHRVRPDTRLLVNQLLTLIPELRPIFFPVDVLGGSECKAKNFTSTRNALRWLKQGNCLGVFPAGEVASWRFPQRRVADATWDTQVARFARASECTVLPLHFAGCNRLRFHLAGLVHPRLRTVMLPSEMLARRGQTVRISVGHAIRYRRLTRFSGDCELMAYLRFRCEALGESDKVGLARTKPAKRSGKFGDKLADKLSDKLGDNLADKPGNLPRASVPGGTVGNDNLSEPTSKLSMAHEPVVEPTPTDNLRRDLSALPADRLLLDIGSCKVFHATGPEMPHVMREIGRLRELTFRQVGEGTGKAVDLDDADSIYTQLFAWDEKKQAIMGAYRIAKSDEVVVRHGVEGLYTHSLFRYGPELLEELGPALELGRSFVPHQYQSSPQSLFLLWKGIATFIARHPRYRTLFGPVTISGSYKALSTHLMIEFLRERLGRQDLRRHVRARHPLCPKRMKKSPLQGAIAMVSDMRTLSELISGIEDDRKPVPILVEHYVRLGGRFVDFSIDPAFNHAVDAFVIVDLLDTDPQILERYMGAQQAAAFLAYHRDPSLRACA